MPLGHERTPPAVRPGNNQGTEIPMKHTDCRVHTDTVARVGTLLAWQCEACGRLEVTDTDLLRDNPTHTEKIGA